MVTSCEENTGKTTIVANLAVTMALNDKNILIIDCDLRKGELSKMFNVFHNSPGLIDFLEKGGSPSGLYQIIKENIYYTFWWFKRKFKYTTKFRSDEINF